MTSIEELARLLRPAGGGIYLVSTGKAEQEALQRKLYHAKNEAEVQARWREALGRIADAKAFVLGVPSDVGAGFRRGANLGPWAIRAALLEELPGWPDGVVDIGDVFVVPQLLHDEMLSEAQKERTRRALYPDVPDAERAKLPVSPLSIAERVIDLVFATNPRIAPIVLGGDHSTAWPVVAALSRARRDRWGIVQPDAHTDLLEERLGITYCFATWSWHANELFGRDGRLEVFYSHLIPLLEFVLPQYVAEGKAHLMVAIGCTGGRHRSVAIAEHLAAVFRDREELFVEVNHRDVDRLPLKR